MIKEIQIEQFLELRKEFQVIDVRSPLEFNKAHIPDAINIPLFSDEERAIVGTIYKKEGRNTAIKKGLEFTGKKLSEYISTLESIAKSKTILIYCFRGGMRSKSLAWLFDMYGFNVYVLRGGYKIYRNFVLNSFDKPYKLIVLGGMTGSGKTEILHLIKNNGSQVIDLENLAHHKGSAFGFLGQEQQPSSEYFENLLFDKLCSINPDIFTWVEDESKAIGHVFIPDSFFNQIRNSKIIFIDIPKKFRIARLVRDYACFEHEKLQFAIDKIKKRLGGLNYQLASDALKNKEYDTVSDITLSYYDKAYLFGLYNRNNTLIYKFPVEHNDIEKIAKELIQYIKQFENGTD